ncbi:unnamed protein product [Lepidochelys kempii]
MLQNALLVGFTALSSACLLRGFVQGDSVLQSPLEVTVSEGYDVLLQCNFTIMSNSPNLFWYHQYPNQAPQHILTAYKSPEEKSASTSGKLSNVLLQYNKTVPLKIEAVSLQNRAVYHCALRPTLGQSCVSGNKRSAVGGESIQSNKPKVARGEGDNVTLSCSYNTSYSDVYLYWYHQFPDQGPKYVLRTGAKAYSSVRGFAEFAKKRFTPQADDTSTVVTITALEMADTALYYCALQRAQ